jgi:hypothetical protein
MSQTIWTRCGGRSNARRLRGHAWRVVEAQHRVATRKLVDTLEEQALLEELIDGVKPRAPAADRRLHWLLTTPFRYPPLRYGSRFGRRHERGIWYGSRAVPTALAEAAYYRLLFLDGSAAALTLQLELTIFSVAIDTSLGIDLTRPPFARHAGRISSPVDYGDSQALGSAMRADGVELFEFRSARCPASGSNLGLLSPKAFASRRPLQQETWTCHAARSQVDFIRRDLIGRRQALGFPRATFEIEGRLPAPAV